MKLFVGAILFLLLFSLLLCFISAQVRGSLEECLTLLAEEAEDPASSAMQGEHLREAWERGRLYLALTVHHESLEEIEGNILRLCDAIERNDKIQAHLLRLDLQHKLERILTFQSADLFHIL